MRRKPVRSYPRHPFPCLAQGSPRLLHVSSRPTSPKSRHLIALIRKGARVLFDIKEQRALLYTWERGFTQLCEITVHMLSSLIRSGKVVRVGEECHRVHFAYAGTSGAWFEPENHL